MNTSKSFKLGSYFTSAFLYLYSFCIHVECKCCCRILHVVGRIGQERHANIIAILGYTVNEVTSLILFVHELSPFGNLLQWMHQIKLVRSYQYVYHSGTSLNDHLTITINLEIATSSFGPE